MSAPGPGDWVWLKSQGCEYAFTPDAYAELVSIVGQLGDTSRHGVPQAQIILAAASLLEQRGWLRIDVFDEQPVIALVPEAERGQQRHRPQRAKRRQRKRAVPSGPPRFVVVPGGLASATDDA